MNAEPVAKADNDLRGTLWEQLGTLLLAVLVALAIRACAVEPFRIPSGSMFPTLLIGDHLFVNKFIYGIKVPFSEFRLPGLRDPQRGDVVVFTVARRGSTTYPADQHPELPREEFVKRIIGLPGEQIEVRDSVVYVNGSAIEASPTGEMFPNPMRSRLEHYAITDGERSYEVLDDLDTSSRDFPPESVPAGRYFMLGDNRDHSKDSRYWGTVRLSEIKGPAFVVYWSWNFNGSWGELLDPRVWWDLLGRQMRWGRIGEGIN
ncbi:MAG: signal peptidase I [Myxococcota bacterium]